MKKHIGLLFVLLTYILTWSVKVPTALTTFGYATISLSKGLQTICTLSPGIVAIILVLIFFGKTGLKSLLKSTINWKVNYRWYLIVAFLGVGLCGLSLQLFDWMTGQNVKPDEPYNFFFYFILILPLSALWEEIGWRGFLFPLLKEKYSSIKSSLIIGLIWGFWHFPIYFALNPYGDKTFIFFLIMFVGCFTLSVITAWLFNSTNGSVLICILFHNAVNASAAYFYGNLKGQELRPLLIWVVLLVISAIIIYFKTKGRLGENRELQAANIAPN